MKVLFCRFGMSTLCHFPLSKAIRQITVILFLSECGREGDCNLIFSVRSRTVQLRHSKCGIEVVDKSRRKISSKLLTNPSFFGVGTLYVGQHQREVL
jgi:predicted metalloprotease